MNFYLGGEYPITFRADLAEPASFVDPRLYMSVLLEDFQARGGQVVVGALDASQVAALSEMHDLMVVASGRGSLIQMFPRIPEYSPYTAPQRILAAGYWEGFVEVDPHYMSFVIAPGHGEIFQGSLASFGRYQHNLLFEGIPGQGFEILTSVRYEDNPRRYAEAALEVLRTHAPTIYKRIDPAEFRPTGPLDVIQGAITPTVREGYVALDNGKFVMALGDVHISNASLVLLVPSLYSPSELF